MVIDKIPCHCMKHAASKCVGNIYVRICGVLCLLRVHRYNRGTYPTDGESLRISDVVSYISMPRAQHYVAILPTQVKHVRYNRELRLHAWRELYTTTQLVIQVKICNRNRPRRENTPTDKKTSTPRPSSGEFDLAHVGVSSAANGAPVDAPAVVSSSSKTTPRPRFVRQTTKAL